MEASEVKGLVRIMMGNNEYPFTTEQRNICNAIMIQLMNADKVTFDAFKNNEDFHVIAKDVDGELHILLEDRKTFSPLSDIGITPIVSADKYFLEEEIDDLRENHARVVKASEVIDFVPGSRIKF